jgi:hypothetical protein
MTKKILIAGAVAVAILSSCSKTLILSDGKQEKKIKVAHAIKTDRNQDNNTILSFQSVLGTKYSINTTNYTYVIK